MTRLLDWLLIAMAAVAGAVLVLAGKQYVFRGAKSRPARTFLFTLSMVTVFLGSSLFSRAHAKEPIPERSRESMVEMENNIPDRESSEDVKLNPFWRKAQWDKLTDRFDELGKMKPSELTADRQKELRKEFGEQVSAFRIKTKISDDLAGYLDNEYKRRLEIRAMTEKPECEPGSEFVKVIEETKKVCETLDKADEESLFVRNLLRERLREQLAELKGFDIKTRLQNIGITREKYLAGLSDALDALSNYSKSAAQMRTIYLRTLAERRFMRDATMPRAITPSEIEEGRIVAKRVSEAQVPLRVYKDFAGEVAGEAPDVWVKRAGGEYVQLKEAGVDLFNDDIIVNKSEEEITITLKDGRYFKLGPKEIRVLWEVEVVTPPETLGKVKALIEKLGADEYEDREAAQHSLASMGALVRTHLEKAAREHADIEVRARAVECLKAIDDMYVKKNSGELYVEPKKPGQ